MTKPLWMQIREAFERKGYFHPSPELRDELVGIAIDYADQKTAAARAEIERLTKERDEAREWGGQARIRENRAEDARIKAEDERDALQAALKDEMREHLQHLIRSLTPADAEAALEAYGREKVREGMQRAVELYPQGIAAILAAMEKEGEE